MIPALSKLTSLTKIHLVPRENSLIQAENIVKLLKALSAIKTLTDIALRLTPFRIVFDNTSIEPLTEGLEELNASSIRKLTLNLYKNFTDEGLGKISQALRKFTSLEILRLDLPQSKEITDEGLAQLSFALNKLISLTSLSLAFSGFTQKFGLALKSLQNLVYLKLRFQNTSPSPNQIQLLSSSVAALKTSLKFLEIHFAEQSFFPNSLIKSLSETLKELILLKHLSLNFPSPNLTPREVEALSITIQGLSNLSSLSLGFENSKGIDEKTVDALSETFRNLPSLYSIGLNLLRCDKVHPEGGVPFKGYLLSYVK